MVSGRPRAGEAADVLWPLPSCGVPLHPNLKKMTADQRKDRFLVFIFIIVIFVNIKGLPNFIFILEQCATTC
jgi:hypothetical protein